MEFKAIPSFAKSYKKEYIFLLGINHLFEELLNYFRVDGDINFFCFKDVSRLVAKIANLIRKYKQGIDYGNLQSFDEKDVNYSDIYGVRVLEDIISDHFYDYKMKFRTGELDIKILKLILNKRRGDKTKIKLYRYRYNVNKIYYFEK